MKLLIINVFKLHFYLPETNTQKGPSVEDQEAIKVAQNCIRECHLEQLITESKFLRIDSLQHFVKVSFFTNQNCNTRW